MTFSLATIDIDGRSTAVIVDGQRCWSIADLAKQSAADLPQTLIEIFQKWEECGEIVLQIGKSAARGAATSLEIPFDRNKLKIPLEYPRKVFCTGANYADHLEEMGVSVEKRDVPFFFMKPATTALAGPGPTVHIPPGCSKFDWEGEVVVVFGKGGTNIPAARALDYVAGYTLGIDFTSRNEFDAPHVPFKFDFALGKCQDRTAPVGPTIVPAEFVNLADIPFELSVNGVRKQSSSTEKMIYSLQEQISGISKFISIEAGDILFTGSPAGVGEPRGEYLQEGDKVSISSPLTGEMEVILQKFKP